MMQGYLLGSTALVSAGLLMSGSAQAQEARVGGIQVVLGGFTKFGVSAASRDTLTDSDNNRNYFFYMDNEVFINANGATESGILYGSTIELEVGSGDGSVEDVTVDEVALYFSGNFGRIELGREDGAEEVMAINGSDAQAGTGGIDGDTTNLVQFELPNTDDSNKVTYFTPRIAGFQLGGSFVPDNGDGVSNDEPSPVQEDVVGLGGNWVGAFERSTSPWPVPASSARANQTVRTTWRRGTRACWMVSAASRSASASARIPTSTRPTSPTSVSNTASARPTCRRAM